MAKDDVATIARLYAVHLGDPKRLLDPAILDFFDPEVVIEQDESFFGTQGTFHGHEGLLRSAQEMFEQFRDMYFRPQEIVAVGEDRVLAVAIAHVRGKESGAEITKPVGHIWTLRHGRVVSWRVVMDPARARREVGLGGSED